MARNMKSFIENKVKKRIAGYRNENELITSEYARENELGRSYKGREILELIQNAEDELTENQPKEVFISFDGKELSIANYGEPFSEEGITSLMYSNTSNKRNRKKKVIGNKGTGFRSILGWADEIRIDSADLHIKFSHKHAQEVLKNEVFKDEKLPKGKKAATLVFPEWQDSHINGDYTTEISLKIKENERVIEDIREQLENLNSNLLLFLNRTERLVISLENKTICFEKEILGKDKVRLTKKEQDKTVYSKEWLLNKKNGVISDENYTIIIAYDTEGGMPDNPYIYSYFQTDVRFPFPALLHADFNLNGDRNHLCKNDTCNRQILEDVAELLVDTASKIYDKVSYSRLRFLIPQTELEAELERYDFLGMLYEKMKTAELFPTVNNRYVPYDKSLKFYSSGLAKYLSGKEFPDLLMFSDYTEICNLLRKFGYSTYAYSEIAAKVKRWVSSRKVTDENIRKIAYTAIQFLNEFGDSWQFEYYKEQCPSFFFNIDRKIIPSGTSIFLVDEEYMVSKPPKFAKVEFMDPYMRNYFYKRLKDEVGDNFDTDSIIEKLGAYNVREYTSIELIDHMNDVIRTKIDSGKLKDAGERWKTLVKWLWNNRRLLLDEGESLTINFLTRNSTFELSNRLYYGSEYGNQLCEDLIGDIAPQFMACDIKEYIDCDEDDLKSFLRLFGISEFPRMSVKKYSEWTGYNEDKCSRYVRTMFGRLSFPITLDNTDVFRDLDDFCRQVKGVELQRTEIDLLEEILNKSSTASVIRWIRSDNSLQNHLYTGFENANHTVYVKWGDRRTFRPLASMGRPYSYIFYLFETIPWVQVNGSRYALSECVLGLDSQGVDVSDYLVEPAISDYIQNLEGPPGKLKKEFRSIFEKLQVKKDITELSFSKIYGLLNYLPSVEGAEEFARRLCNSMIDRTDWDLSSEDLECKEYLDYMRNGEILTNNGFKPVSESYYLDGKDICEKVAKTYNLILIPKKRNRSRIKTLFGVEQLVLLGRIVGSPSIHFENGSFCSDLKQFKMFAFAYRIGKVSDIRREAKLFREIEINICTEIKARYKTEKEKESQEIELDDYEYILEGKSTYYLKVPSDLDYSNMKYNMQLASSVANIFSSYLDVSDLASRYRELYYVGTYDDRLALIEQEFEDDGIIRKSKELLNADEDIQEEFLSIVSKLSGKPESVFTRYANKIDFEEFSSEYNIKPIIEMFRYAGINATDFNSEMPPIAIDIRPYYEKQVQNILPYYRDKYKASWFKRLKNRSLEERINLVSEFLQFDSVAIRVENDIDFDVHMAIINQLEIDNNVEGIDLVAIYNENYMAWKKRQVDLRFIDEFMNRPDNMSLLYYAEYDELTTRYRLYCDEFAENDVEDSLAQTEEVKRTIEAFRATSKPVKTKKRGSKGRTTTGFTVRTSKKEQEKIGLLGEQLVYEYLLQDKSLDKVDWVSENAKMVGVNPEGGAGYGYDIEFVDSAGRRKYVEVKASKSSREDEIRFYMSDFEYKFGCEHAEDYLIYYVSGTRGDHPQILIFDNVFKNHCFNKKSFTLDISSEYTITGRAEIG